MKANRLPHPEDDDYEGEEGPGFDEPRPAQWTGFDSPEMDDNPGDAPRHQAVVPDDEIPF